DPAAVGADDEDAALGRRGFELRHGAAVAAEARRALEQLERAARQLRRGALVRERGAFHRPVLGEQDGRLDLRRDLGEVRQCLDRVHRTLTLPRCRLPAVRVRRRLLVQKFFADRGTHLAAMVAYFALLSFVPLVFIALSLFGLAHRADASSFFVRELKRAFPGSSLQSILTLVHKVQENATTLGIIGGIGLVWSSVSLFSALESALNIVYDRPNRRFLHGKGVAAAMTAGLIATLFASLVVGSFGVDVLRRYVPSMAGNGVLVYATSIGASLV